LGVLNGDFKRGLKMGRGFLKGVFVWGF